MADEIKVPDPVLTTQANADSPAPAPAPAPAPTPTFDAKAADIAAAGQYTANTGTFDETKGVEGRVASISNSGSPLMQLAATRAKQAANRSGLLNSSMAVGAGQRAVIDAATPIAQADAASYQQQQLTNQASLNDAAMRNAAVRAAAGTDAMKLGESARQFDTGEAGLTSRANTQLAQQESQFTRGMAHDVDMAKLDAQTREKLTQMQGDNQALISGNQNIANAWGTMMTGIQQIQNNPDLDEATKQTLINNTINGFQSFTSFWQKSTGGNIDVSNLLDFGVSSAAAPGAAPAAPTPNGQGSDQYIDPSWSSMGP
jgi:hypothetical protein